MRKKIFIAAFAAATLSFAGCANTETPAQTTENITSKTTEATVAEENESVLYEFMRYELTTDFEGNPAVWIYSRVTNTGSESMLASLIAFPNLFQNGVELEVAIPAFSDTEKVEFQNCSKEIQSGASIEIAQLYRLQDNSTITVEVSNLINWFAEKETFEIELQEL